MDKIKDTIEAKTWDHWEDSGDYPNALASGPLPAGPWIPEDVSGSAVFRMDPADWEELKAQDGELDVARFFGLSIPNRRDPEGEDFEVTKVEYRMDGAYIAVVVPTEIEGEHEVYPV